MPFAVQCQSMFYIVQGERISTLCLASTNFPMLPAAFNGGASGFATGLVLSWGGELLLSPGAVVPLIAVQLP